MKQLTTSQIEKLKEPLPKEAVKPHPTKNYLSSIKAIYVVERLNEVFGLGGWFARNEIVKEEGKWVVVRSTFEAPEYGIVIPDIFGGNDNADLGDAYKGACTDALTKIGSYLYIGMDVYKGLNGEKPKTIPAKAVSKEFYDTWSKEVDKCKTESDLQTLWNGNKATCEQDETIKAFFVNRKNQLKKTVHA